MSAGADMAVAPGALPVPGDHPELVALAVLFLAVAAAFGARAGIARLAARDGRDGPLGSTLRALGPAAFWVIVVAAVAFALGVLGAGRTTGLVDETLRLLPRLIFAALVVCAGHLVGVAVRETLQRRVQLAFLPPRGGYWLAVGPAVIVAAQQVGIEVSFVADLALIGFAAAAAALGLAFALGARAHVANLIARRELDAYREGDHLRIDAIDGTVVEVRRTCLVLATRDGLTSVPAARFAEAPVVRLTETAE